MIKGLGKIISLLAAIIRTTLIALNREKINSKQEPASLAQSARHSTVVYATPGSIPPWAFFLQDVLHSGGTQDDLFWRKESSLISLVVKRKTPVNKKVWEFEFAAFDFKRLLQV